LARPVYARSCQRTPARAGLLIPLGEKKILQPLTPADVQAALDHWGLGIQIRYFEDSTATSQQAAERIGCELGQIAKSLCFKIDERPILVIASGDQRVDDRKLAAIFGVSRKKVKVAGVEECMEVYGFTPGGVPPLAHRTKNLEVLLDDSLKRFRIVYASGGADNAVFSATLDQLAEISGGVFASLRRES
jgi:prolyl-tRNA editing enzyme YbaK/EbsC (Cys-tRNA(Pro) deacylase)